MDTVGVPAHRGGFLVERPEVTVGVVRAVSRSGGLEVELIARVPGERGGPAGDRWPPVYDEGVDPRVGWVDGERVRWVRPVVGSPTSHFQFPNGFFRAVFAFPPLFGDVSLVVAWPQVDFPETVVPVSLPERAVVERDDSPLWAAGGGVAVVGDVVRLPSESVFHEFDVESGVVVAGPVVLHGGDGVVVVLTRMTSVGSLLSFEVSSIAKGEKGAVVRAAFGPPSPGDWRRPRYGVAIGVVDGGTAHELRSSGGGASADDGGYRALTEYVLPGHTGDILDLLVSWPLVGLDEVLVRVDLDGGRLSHG